MKTSPNRRAIYHYAEQFPELLMVNEVYIKTTPPSCFEVRGAGRGAAFFFSFFSRPLPSPRRRKVGEPNVTRGGVLQNKCGFSFKEMCRYRYLLNVGSNGYANKLKCAAAAHGSSPTCCPAAPPLTAAPPSPLLPSPLLPPTQPRAAARGRRRVTLALGTCFSAARSSFGCAGGDRCGVRPSPRRRTAPLRRRCGRTRSTTSSSRSSSCRACTTRLPTRWTTCRT